MKGDFSRYRFDPAKHYAAVLEQQGRVQLDADANEQRAIDAYRLATETIDVIGRTGAPIHKAGFAISLRSDNASLLIGPGRYYVDGLLCELAAPTDYGAQPFLIDPQPGIAAMLSDLHAGRNSGVRVWLEAWERMVTPIDDPCIKDPALGEADTTVRVQTVYRVVAEAAAPATAGQADVASNLLGLTNAVSALHLASGSTELTSVVSRATALSAQISAGTITNDRLAASLSALHASASQLLSRLPPASAAQLAAPVNAIAPTPDPAASVDCCVAMRRPPVFVMPGEMTATTGGTTDLGPCLPSPQAAYRGLENQLYRIEVHQGGSLAQATFKWSRDNGSVLSSILNVSGKVLTVDSLGPDANLGFAPLQWVEISDDADEFGQPPNQPGQLRQIQTVDYQHNRITLTEVAPLVNIDNGHAKLRRWDHTDATATDSGIPMGPTGVNSLENGIEVQFSDAYLFQPGDFWLAPARTATGEIEWPPCDSDGAAYQPAHNVRVHRAPLGCIDWEPAAGGLVVHDCRDFFYPLTELTPAPSLAALHVTAINWRNDDVQTLDTLLTNGLTLTLDGAPISGVDPARFSVALEFPLSLDEFDRLAVVVNQRGLVRTPLIIDGAIAVKGSDIVWSLPPNLYYYLASLLGTLTGYAEQGEYVRARVRLRGGMIWGSGTAGSVYLDGQCFGAAATRADGKTPRTDLTLPSGAAARASDFESWFDLAPVPAIASMTVTPPAVAWVIVPGALILRLVDAANQSAAASPVLTLTLNYEVIASTQVAITVSGGTAGIVSVPSPITIPAGAMAPAQAIPITVGNPGAVTQTYTLTANVILASGYVYQMQATLTVTGHAPLGRIPVFTGPILSSGGALSAKIASPAAATPGTTTPAAGASAASGSAATPSAGAAAATPSSPAATSSAGAADAPSSPAATPSASAGAATPSGAAATSSASAGATPSSPAATSSAGAAAAPSSPAATPGPTATAKASATSSSSRKTKPK